MIIDVWMQHPTLRFIQHDMFASLRRWMKGAIPTEEIPLSLTVGLMDAAGVSQGLLSAWHGPQGALISNDEVHALVQRHSDRFIGIGSVDISRPMEAVREARRCVRQLGFKGIRIIPWLWNLPPNDRRYYPVYAECVELGVPFLLQVGHTGPLRPSEPGRPIPYLDDVALEFPELVIVGGHIGYPWTNEMIALATKYENVYIDTSAYIPKRFPRELVDYMRGSGRKKVMFGTNYPMLTPAMCLEGLDGLGLDEEARSMYLYRNAQRVFGLGRG